MLTRGTREHSLREQASHARSPISQPHTRTTYSTTEKSPALAPSVPRQPPTGTAATACHPTAVATLAAAASLAAPPALVAAAPPPGPASATHAIGAHRARGARGCAWSGGGAFGCHGAVEVVEGKPAAAQTARETRLAVVKGRREHDKGTPAGVGSGQEEVGFGQRLSRQVRARSEKRSKQSGQTQLRTEMKSSWGKKSPSFVSCTCQTLQ